MPAVQPVVLKWAWQMTPLGVMAGALTPKGVGALVFAADPQAGFLDLRARLERRFQVVSWTECPAELTCVWQRVNRLLDPCNSGNADNIANRDSCSDKDNDNHSDNVTGAGRLDDLLPDSSPDSLPDLPPDAGGTAFQQRVWQAISGIPEGHTASYSDLAAHLGLTSGARAVAAACAANPLAVLIPCHRVVAADGSLSGYRWGLERKRWLLQVERERRSGVTSSPNASLQT